MNRRMWKSEIGASLTEYVIIASIIIVIFISAEQALRIAAEFRRDASLNTTATNLPCEADLSSDECK